MQSRAKGAYFKYVRRDPLGSGASQLCTPPKESAPENEEKLVQALLWQQTQDSFMLESLVATLARGRSLNLLPVTSSMEACPRNGDDVKNTSP